ncbi:MAG: lipopolysaccharide biosynthesis protein [Firmicutes bacterium]|nr:lipopolysaccharide biosynthesis protein [Bacillota bacterium]
MLFRVIKKRIRLIVVIGLVAVLGAALLNYVTPPTYEAEAKLRLRPPKPLTSSLLQENSISNSFASKQQITTYIEMLKSRMVIELAMQKLGNPAHYEQVLSQMNVQPVKDTEILKISVQAETPERAREMTEALVGGFTERVNQVSSAEQKTIREFIEGRLTEAKEDLGRAEKELAAYKQVQRIYAPAEESRALVEMLYATRKMVQENQVNLLANQARLGSAKQQLSSESPGVIADNVVIQQYKTKLAGLEVELAEIQRKYTEKHPKVLALQDSVSVLRGTLESEIEKVIRLEAPSQNIVHQGLLQNRMQAEAEVAAAIARNGVLMEIIAENEKRLAQLPEKELEIARLTRNVVVGQDTYMMLAKRHEEARINEAMQIVEVQMVDLASLPQEPIKPRRLLNIILATIFGLFTGITLAALLEFRCQPQQTTTRLLKEDISFPGKLPELVDGIPPRRKAKRKKRRKASLFSYSP